MFNTKEEYKLFTMPYHNKRYKKLIITKIINKLNLLKGLKNIYCTESLQELVEKMNSLPYEDDLLSDDEIIKNALDGNAEYSYLLIPIEGDCVPPWETQEYIEAEQWMKSLPEAEQNKIKVLLRYANIPWG